MSNYETKNRVIDWADNMDLSHYASTDGLIKFNGWIGMSIDCSMALCENATLKHYDEVLPMCKLILDTYNLQVK